MVLALKVWEAGCILINSMTGMIQTCDIPLIIFCFFSARSLIYR